MSQESRYFNLRTATAVLTGTALASALLAVCNTDQIGEVSADLAKRPTSEGNTSNSENPEIDELRMKMAKILTLLTQQPKITIEEEVEDEELPLVVISSKDVESGLLDCLESDPNLKCTPGNDPIHGNWSCIDAKKSDSLPTIVNANPYGNVVRVKGAGVPYEHAAGMNFEWPTRVYDKSELELVIDDMCVAVKEAIASDYGSQQLDAYCDDKGLSGSECRQIGDDVKRDMAMVEEAIGQLDVAIYDAGVAYEFDGSTFHLEVEEGRDCVVAPLIVTADSPEGYDPSVGPSVALYASCGGDTYEWLLPELAASMSLGVKY